jgi:serine/threonine protein kinase
MDAGAFELFEEAALGGMGAVHRGRWNATGEPCAIKILNTTTGDAARFANEVRALSGLEHPGIVRYMGHGEMEDGRQYLAMEWLEGESLGQRLTARGALAVDETVRLAADVADALGAAHAQGITHRDIKPTNIFLVSDGRTKLLDFGVARLREVSLTKSGQLLGTPAYMSPEQAAGVTPVDERADVFSLGCVIFRCIAGQRAFEGDDVFVILRKVIRGNAPKLSDLVPGVRKDLDDLVTRMIAKSPDDRPRTAAVVREELNRILA